MSKSANAFHNDFLPVVKTGLLVALLVALTEFQANATKRKQCSFCPVVHLSGESTVTRMEASSYELCGQKVELTQEWDRAINTEDLPLHDYLL